VYASGQGASSRSISCAVEASDTTLAVQTVHTSFHLAHQRASLLVLGRGTVGRELLAQVARERERLDRDHGILLTVVGVADSKGIAFDPRGIAADAPTSAAKLDDVLEKMRALPVPILVVAANKKPLSSSMAAYREVMESGRRHHRSYLYETTVGASLPVIETLKDLVRTGDTVRLIEGSFSGTLGYLTNQIMTGVPLSRAVATARELGYSEPQPQDDLSGLDVARKALILARELGLNVEPADIAVEPFVDRDLLEIRDVEAFLVALAARDGEAAERVNKANAAGAVIRYLARIDLAGENPRIVVGPITVDRGHPAATLRGSEAFVAFSTGRYAEYPLIVRGSGAGGAVTAAGVLADVLKVAQRARGR
jgi:aspartokinase/homoserine dehydrogenase 1